MKAIIVGLVLIAVTIAAGFIRCNCDAETWAQWRLVIAIGLGLGIGAGIGLIIIGATRPLRQ